MNDPTSVFVKPIHLFLLVLIGIVPFFHPAHAETEQVAGKVLFILDASGSMWGRVEGKEKIVVAKEVMTNLVKELPDKIEVGLQAYGHRSKGDCNDIEMMVPVGASEKNVVIEKINAINPKGKTPISKSFEVASERLKGIEEQTTVVLISDGKETCEGNPCELVRSLRKEGINVRVHVVGFDVNKEERDQLICIAEAGEGKYFNADNAEQLTVALTEVRREIVAAEPQPPVEQALPAIVTSSDCPNDFRAFGGTKVPLTCDCSAEATQKGGVWGMDVYTFTSSICRAALHVGVVTPTGGTVTVVPQPGRDAYAGVQRNEVHSATAGKHKASFGFAK